MNSWMPYLVAVAITVILTGGGIYIVARRPSSDARDGVFMIVFGICMLVLLMSIMPGIPAR